MMLQYSTSPSICFTRWTNIARHGQLTTNIYCNWKPDVKQFWKYLYQNLTKKHGYLRVVWITPLDSLCPILNESFLKVDFGPAPEENTDSIPSPSSPTFAFISQVCLEHWQISAPKSHFPVMVVILHVGAFVSITWNHDYTFINQLMTKPLTMK
jgi:hypothetical protein